MSKYRSRDLLLIVIVMLAVAGVHGGWGLDVRRTEDLISGRALNALREDMPSMWTRTF